MIGRSTDARRPRREGSASERLRYRFDSWMSRGTGAIMVLLGAATILFVVALGLLVQVLGAFPDGHRDSDLWDIIWGNLMRTLDPGTMGADRGWGFRFLMLLVTIGGLIIVASLIGIISGAFNDKMLQLRRGRSRVIETDHTLILGWNEQLFTIVSELCEASAPRRGGTIVVLAERDKVEMEDEIHAKVPHTGRTKIICRSGDPLRQLDLRLVSPNTARSIVILPSNADEHPDAAVIKTSMALSHQFSGNRESTIVAELKDASNLATARLAGGDRARWLLAEELISRMTVQTCMQSGLSTVCTELIDFAGDEIYFHDAAELVGATYLDAQLAFADCVVIGVKRGDVISLNPPASDQISAGSELVVIAADASPIRQSAPAAIASAAINREELSPQQPERLLVLGSNAHLQWMLDDLGNYLAPGSTIVVATSVAGMTVRAPDSLRVEIVRMDTTSRAALERLDLNSFHHVLVLAYSDALESQVADAKTLVTLLHLRDLTDRHGLDINIVSEIVDDQNRELAEVARPDDFIVSNRLISLMLTQVSENPGLIDIFEELFSGQGSEIYVRPASHYVELGVEIDFYTVVAAAAGRGETALGYRVAAQAHASEQRYGVHLNPPKGERTVFSNKDRVIVLAAS